MGETVGHHAALGLALDAVVADGAGGVKSLLDVALLQYFSGLIGVVRPHSGETVGLQLKTYRCRVVAALYLRMQAQQVLHMVAHFVGDHIGLGEIARRAKALAQFVEKNGVQVNPVHYFFNDLNAKDYEKIIELASVENQSLGM